MSGSRVDAHFQRTLEDIASVSQRIRFFTLSYADNADAESLRTRIEVVRSSAETIHEAITLQNRSLDESLFTWVFSGELVQCLHKLKEMEGILALKNQLAPVPAPPLEVAADKVTKAIVLFNEHKNMFRFLLDPNLWDHTPPLHQSPQATQLELPRTTEETSSYVEETMAMTKSIAVTMHNAFIQQKLDEVSRWLAALDCTEKHVETLKLRQPGTCTWFPRTAAYKVWRTGKSTFLWLCGQAGCGKSVTVASTLEHLRTTLEAGEALVYFYCDFRNERSMSVAEVMRSLLSQLFRRLRDFRVDPGALPNWILEQKRDSGASLLEDLNRLTSWVCRAASRFPRKPLIVIDALDECANIKELLDALTVLIHADVRLLVTSRPQEIIQHHLGRYPSLSFEEMDRELAADIDMHIKRELGSHAGHGFADADVRNVIHEKLHEKADGRFRWIQCQLDTLKRCSSMQEVQQVLDDLPEGLGASYERILEKIDERRLEGKVARRALAWLVVALMPLRLVQLVNGFMFDPEQRGMDGETQSLGSTLVDILSSLVSYDDKTGVIALSHYTVKEYLTSYTALPMYRVIPHQAHIMVLEMCMSCITSLVKHAPFHADPPLLESFPVLSYAFSTGFDHISHLEPESTLILDMLESFASNIQHHPSHWDLLCELREEGPRRLYPPWPSSRHDLVLYILIAYSSSTLLQSFLQSRPLEPRPGTNPLVYAADLSKTSHAMTLLRNGADIHTPGLVIDDSRHALPLEVAVDLGNDELVGELLRRGSMVPSVLLSTAVCMPWCTVRVLVHLVHTDAFTEWAREIGDEKLYRAIFSSARPNAGDATQADRDYVALARRLREVGQNLAPDSLFGAELVERALHAARPLMLEYLLPPGRRPPARFLIAACTGNTSDTVAVVRVLIQQGVNLHAVSRGRRHTALHLAAMSPWEPRALELAKTLLNAGCKPTVRNRLGQTAMSIAMGRGYISVVEHFLSRFEPVRSSSLLYALQGRAKPPMIQFLIGRGANIHAQTSNGNTVLHLVVMRQWDAYRESWKDENLAMERVEDKGRQDLESSVSRGNSDNDGNEGGDENEVEVDYEYEYEYDFEDDEEDLSKLCKIFVEAGCEPTSSDAQGRSVLQLAVENNRCSVVEYLLSRGVPVSLGVLSIALRMWSWSTSIMKLLICRCADVHSRTDDGDTILHLAVAMSDSWMSLSWVKILIEAGCDPTSTDAQGKSVLELAINRRHASVVEHLLSCGVPVPPGILPIVLQGGLPLHIIELLVRKCADAHSQTDGDTILHLAVTRFQESQCLDCIKLFTKARYNPTSTDAQGRSVLELAINRRYTTVVEYLLSCGVPVPPGILPIVLQGGLPLHIIELLVRKCADAHSQTDGDTILHLAVTGFQESQCLDCIKFFIKAGRNPTSTDAQGRSVLDLAINRGYASVVEHLLSCGAPVPPRILPIVLQSGFPLYYHVVELLIHKGADVHSRTDGGDTILHLSITNFYESQCLVWIKLFIKAGCDPTSSDAQGRSVLDLAINSGCSSVVEHLLSRGVPVLPGILPTALQRCLPLHIVKLLLRKGADVHFTTSSGDTLLHLAISRYAESTCLELVRCFVEAGSNPKSSGAGGRTLLETAVHRGYTAVFDLLLSYKVPFPPDILLSALWLLASPKTIQFLILRGADVHYTTLNGETLVDVAYTAYNMSDVSGDGQCIIETLRAALVRVAKRVHASLGDGETSMTHVAKRSRLG